MTIVKKHFVKLLLIISLPVVFIAADTQNSKFFEISKNLDVFATLYRELNGYYVDDVEPSKLMRAGIDAMLETLDPYTNFISEDEIEDYRMQTTGKYGGIGSMIRKIDNFIVVSEPYESYPAFKAGLQAGDKIMSIDGQNMKDKDSDDVSKLLKGQAGTNVTLQIKRLQADGTEKEMTVTLSREEIKILNVPYFGMINNEVGYIQLANFTENAGKEVRDAYEKLKLENPALKGMILDLRGNPGGLLNEAVNVSNVFIEKGKEIVSTKSKVRELDRTYRALNAAVDVVMPLVVLTNKGSASASEIVSGSIQDLDRGVILGQRTFGKGLVQTTRSLSYNTKLKITTSKYYVPSGRCIQAINYAEKDEDGSVKKVPDSLQVAFKTANGRTVYDGGGINPDVKTEPERLSEIAISLITKNHIFNYATIYKAKHATIENAKTFHLNDQEYQEFVNYLKDKDYDYKTDTERKLDELKKTAEEEKYMEAVKKDFDALTANIEHDKEKDLVKFKSQIQELLESEIVSRYYYNKGRTEASFDNDTDVKEAIKLLNNKAEYYKLLQPTAK